MKMISIAQANVQVATMHTAEDKPIEEWVLPAVVNFIRIASILPVEPYTSCEGHADWGNPYPAIGFVSKYRPIPLGPPPRKARKLKKWEEMRRHNDEGLLIAERQTSAVVTFLTKELLAFYGDAKFSTGITPMYMFRVDQTDGLAFRLVPVYHQVFSSEKAEGGFYQLGNSLMELRSSLVRFSLWLVKRLEGVTSFEGDDYAHRFRCFGKI